MALKSYVAGIRRLEPGDGVSYGLTFTAEESMFVATVPVGYAEGYRRALSGRAEALLGGERRALLGRGTMGARVFRGGGEIEGGGEGVLPGGQADGCGTGGGRGGWGGTVNKAG